MAMKLTLEEVVCSRKYIDGEGWKDIEFELTEKQKDTFVDLFGYRCQARTSRTLRRFIADPSRHPSYGIYRRVYWDENDECQYCAGQDYTEEVRYIRELIIKDMGGRR